MIVLIVKLIKLPILLIAYHQYRAKLNEKNNNFFGT